MGDLLINYLLLNSGKTSKLNEGTSTDQKADILIASNIFHNMTFNIVISCIWINYDLCYIKYIIWAVSCLCRNYNLKEEHLKSVTPVTFWLTSVNSCWERILYILTMCYGRPLNPKVSVTAPEDFTEGSLDQMECKGMLTGTLLSLVLQETKADILHWDRLSPEARRKSEPIQCWPEQMPLRCRERCPTNSAFASAYRDSQNSPFKSNCRKQLWNAMKTFQSQEKEVNGVMWSLELCGSSTSLGMCGYWEIPAERIFSGNSTCISGTMDFWTASGKLKTNK